MFTRKDYLDRKCSHADFYGQFITPGIKQRVSRTIGLKAILAAREGNSFNDIPLAHWDAVFQGGLPSETGKKIRACGDYPTLAGAVCIAKEAARQLKAESAVSQ